MKKFIIILSAATLTVALAAIMITASLVSKNRPTSPSVSSDITSKEVTSTDKTVEQSKPTVNVTKGASLTRLYDENSITVSEHTEMHHGISCTFNQLSGLKDTAIQEKLNQTIADTQIALLEEYSKEFTPSDSSSTIYVGFSNLISVEYSFMTTNAFDTRQVYYTYNLADGLVVSLKDIFIDSADYIPIINNAFHNELLLEYQNHYDDSRGDYGHCDESGMLHVNEGTLFKTLKKYISQPQSQFGFDDTNIYFSYGEFVASAKMRDIADKLAIFDRFVTEESLFKDNSIGRKDLIPCCEYREYGQSKIETGYLEDNLWFDILVTEYNTSYIPEDQKVTLESLKTRLYADQKSVLEDYIKTAKKKTDKAYIVMQKGLLDNKNGYDYNGAKIPDSIQMYEGTIILEMSRDYFENVYKAKLYDKYRDGYSGLAANRNGKAGIDMQNPNVKEIKYSETLYVSTVDLITGKAQDKRQVDLEKENVLIGGFH